MSISNVCVYCGSSKGKNTAFQEEAERIAILLAKKSIGIVYGGAAVGLMGVFAETALAHQGKVIGILPNFMRNRELAHPNLTELIFVESMHKRKALMEELSDAFIVFPGGIGTMDEFFEILTWKQLELHNKKIIIYNYLNYYQSLISLLMHFIANGLMSRKTFDLIEVVENTEELKTALAL
jgi:hypothetical protein